MREYLYCRSYALQPRFYRDSKQFVAARSLRVTTGDKSPYKPKTLL